MANFFYKYSDYASFQKAFRDTEGEDVVVDILSTDDSLKENEVVAASHVIRKDNRFSQESSFNKFFGPRKSLNRNFDMKDFSSWKNKNYRETEKQIGKVDAERTKFSFADFMNERSGGKVYNDVDQNRSNDQKAINELSSEDPTFKKFSLNDYMRRLEEKTRVNSETRDNEDLIDSIGDITQDIQPDSQQDENFEESVSNINIEKIVGDEDFKGEKFTVDTSELDAMKSRLQQIKAQTEELNELIEDTDEDKQESGYEEDEKVDDLEDDNLSVHEAEELDETSALDESEQTDEDNETTSEETEENLDAQDENSEESKYIGGGYIIGSGVGDSVEEDESQAGGGKISISGNNSSGSKGTGNSGSDSTGGDVGDATSAEAGDINANSTDSDNGQAGSSTSGNGHPSSIGTSSSSSIKVININKTGTNSSETTTVGEGDKSQEIIRLISKNDQERHDIDEKLKQAEKDKLAVMKSYEARLKELEKSIEAKDKETQKRVLLEKIKNDNKLTQVRAEFKLREDEIRRLEKESALKQKIGALLKKELKNNLSISNLEMNNKLLETTSKIAQEKERAKANKPKVTRKRKQKRRIDSDIIGSVDFD